MIHVRCAVCDRMMVDSASQSLMQSRRFPTVFIHGRCVQRILRIWNVVENWPRNELYYELVMTENIRQLVFEAKDDDS